MRTALHWAPEMGHHDTGATGVSAGVAGRLPEGVLIGKSAGAAAEGWSRPGAGNRTAVCGPSTGYTYMGGLCEADVTALVNQGDHNDITPACVSGHPAVSSRAPTGPLRDAGALHVLPARNRT
jgi:hypothetical protein